MSITNKRLANPSLLINNLPIAILPNTAKYTEGLGEQTVEVQSAGGNSIFAVYAEDVSSRMSTVSFDLANTEFHIELVRQWKSNGNANVVIINGDTLSRTFTSMSLTSDYEVGLGADSNISIEFKGNPAI